MKKTNFLMLWALVFLLFGCREELDYVNNENPNQNSYQLTKDNVKTQILHKQDYETRTFLKPSVNRVENFLNTSYSGNSSDSKSTETVNDYEIYTDTFEEVSYRNAKYSSFYIISDRKDGYEEKLVLKSINNQVTEKYILKYKRLPDYSIDPATYETLKLEEKSGNDGSSLMINMEIFKMGCTTYAVTTYDCGEGGHHNGMQCPTSGEWVPHNTVTATFDPNCTSNSDAGAGPGVPGGSPSTGGGSNGNVPGGETPPVITLPTTAPLYIIQRPRGIICNPLDLNTQEITQINSNDNIKLRIYQYLAVNGYNPSICNDLPINLELQVFVKALLKYTNENPNITINDLSLSFLDSVYKFLQDEYYDMNDPLEIFHRIKALDDALAQNPNLLLDIPCGELDDWQAIALHQVPQSVKSKLSNIKNQTSWWSNWEITDLDDAASARINMDLFPVKISSLPNKPNTNQKYTPDEFFEFFRKNINLFAEKFTPIKDDYYGIDDTALWFSDNPLGALIHIEIPIDNGTVVCSGVSSNTWIFSTIKAPMSMGYDGIHPVAGNRVFSYHMVGNEMYIYTRGVDRVSQVATNSPNLANYLIETSAFLGADQLWKGMQEKLSDYVNTRGGDAAKIPAKTYRPNYSKVKNYLKNKAPLSSLGCS